MRVPRKPRLTGQGTVTSRPSNLKHENCGGVLLKAKDMPGRYQCQTCMGIVKLGRSGNYGGSEGYIKSQMRKGKL